MAGAVVGSWVARIPEFKESLDFGEAELGGALFGLSAGALAGMASGGAIVGRYGSRRVTVVAGAILCALLPCIPLAPGPPAFVASLVVSGASIGLLDLGMNAQAVVVEKAYGRPIMSSFHAYFSAGGMVGAGTAGLAATGGVEPLPQFAATGAACVIGLGLAARRLSEDSARVGPGVPLAARPRRGLVALGTIAFCVLLAEGAIADWSAVYLRSTLAAGPGTAAAGFAAFSLTMTVGRLGGDRASDRLGPAAAVRLGAGLAAGGLALTLLTGAAPVALAGLSLVGLGLSVTFPLVLSAAGRTPGWPSATSLAAAASAGYTGLLVGPAMIGLVAEATTLRLALGLVAVLVGASAVCAGSVARG